jgi:hypothetical protein
MNEQTPVEGLRFIGYHFIDWLVLTLGYDMAMVIKNIFIFVSGGISFSIIMLFLVAFMSSQVKPVEDKLNGVNVMSVKTSKTCQIYIGRPTSISEAIETFFALLFFYMTLRRVPVVLRDNARRKVIAWGSVIVLFGLMIFGIMLTFRVVK